MSSAAQDFVRNAIQVAGRAVTFDRERNYQVAIYFYHEALALLQRAVQVEPDNEQWKQKAQEYSDRIQVLQQDIKIEEDSKTEKKKNADEIELEKAFFLVSQALEADEAGLQAEAKELYTKAVAVCLEVRGRAGIQEEVSAKLTSLARHALERAEALKAKENPTSAVGGQAPVDPALISQRAAASSAHPPAPVAPGRSGYTDEEKQVLLKTSRINGIDYMPFLESDLREKFNFSSNFVDRDGLLRLSPKQREKFKRWSRPEELFPNPVMIQRIDSYSIKQTLVSDCSFVASLAISANYEKRFGKKLIRNIIYPQNKAGEPVVNPYGKYMVILIINGVRRRIIIDDLFPTGHHNELLCSYSNNKGELWVSLLEKAYMKVMGGYDFPGSNSNIDLHALTGWIPERRSISGDRDREKTFDMLMAKMREGQLLVTVATGDLNEKVAERAGLVPTHAYAVLDVQEVRGIRLFLLKNPWSHLRWRGNYSELDAVHWTEEMKRLLNYNPNDAQMFDNGVFWIDYDSIIQFFDVIYMSWNPALFHYTYCIHKTWSNTTGPVKDVYSIGDNPQYSLEVNSSGNPTVVWALLTRHITEIQDFKDNKEYITLIVYDNDGKRVYYPENPMIDGVRINSPHYLCKILTPKGFLSKRYTLVVSQYEKTTTIHYTLRVYSSSNFKVGEIVNTCKYTKRIVGAWDARTAGGCQNHPSTYMNNPTYRIELKQEGKLIIDLKGPKEYQLGFDVICTNTNLNPSPGSQSTGGFFKKSTGPFRPGFVVLELPNTPPGIYNVIPATFQPGCMGSFILNIQSTSPFEAKLVPS